MNFAYFPSVSTFKNIFLRSLAQVQVAICSSVLAVLQICVYVTLLYQDIGRGVKIY